MPLKATPSPQRRANPERLILKLLLLLGRQIAPFLPEFDDDEVGLEEAFGVFLEVGVGDAVPVGRAPGQFQRARDALVEGGLGIQLVDVLEELEFRIRDARAVEDRAAQIALFERGAGKVGVLQIGPGEVALEEARAGVLPLGQRQFERIGLRVISLQLRSSHQM